MSAKKVIVNMELPALPAGYEYTGEYRKPAPDEYFLNIVSQNISTVEKAEWMYMAEYPIIKKVEQWRPATLDDAIRALRGERVVARYGGQQHWLIGGTRYDTGELAFFLRRDNPSCSMFRVGDCEVRV